jgi:tetraacyldisaccharide 4'-kinase
MSVGGAARRLARWVWRSPSPGAAAARAALAPASALYWAAVWARNAAYDAQALAARRLPLPSLGVGNLAVGGAGKTPVASYLAAELARRGVRPGILLRGYGGDEAALHREAVPGAVVVAAADRRAGAERAAAEGALALVLDDCLQRRDVLVDVMVALVSAETFTALRWPLPAGPWREGLGALARADAVAVTHRMAAAEAAAALATRLAPRTRLGAALALELSMPALEPLAGGPPVSAATLAGREVVAVCGVAEPELFASQLRRAGALVTLVAHDDHHAYSARDVSRVCALADGGRRVVTTAKDAVKLRPVWPAGGPECWVAKLAVRVTLGRKALDRILDAAADAARATLNPNDP